MSEKSRQAVAVGARLREVRQALGLSLADVEHTSGGRWKAVVVGSYERADRALTVTKLFELAEFYRVPVVELLREEATPRSVEDAARHAQVVADLLRAMVTSRMASDEDEAVAA